MANEEFLFWAILIGFLLGKKIPLNKAAYVKWWYNRKGIAYRIIYILQGGHVVHEGMVKQSVKTFSYDKGRYLNFKKNPIGKEYTSSISKDGQEIMFYNKNFPIPISD